jgi:hypothetical protein
MNQSRSLYEVLNINSDAKPEELAKHYRRLTLTCHPDRQLQNDDVTPEEMNRRWGEIQRAWKILSHPRRRLEYDYAEGLCNDPEVLRARNEDFRAKCHKQSALCADNMALTYDNVIDHEITQNGIYIMAAYYGDLSLQNEFLRCIPPEITKKHIQGPMIDVVIPLQAMVEDHKILIPKDNLKSRLLGFYNPIDIESDAQPCLYILYRFKGALHETIVNETERLWIPMKAHYTETPRGPFAPTNIERLSALQATNDKQVLRKQKQELACELLHILKANNKKEPKGVNKQMKKGFFDFLRPKT